MDYARRSNHEKKPSFSVEDINQTIKYLNNPTNTGYWLFSAKWIKESPFGKFVWNEFESKYQSNQEDKKGIKAKISTLSDEQLKDLKFSVFNRVSFALALFNSIYDFEMDSNNSSKQISLDYRIMFETIDLRRIKKEFNKAYDLFVENIKRDDIFPKINRQELFLTKTGYIFVVDDFGLRNRSRDELIYGSLLPNPINELVLFLKELGCVTDFSIRQIFSPEEKLFQPYFLLCREFNSNILIDNRLRPLFLQSFDEYGNRRYESSISKIGLIAEDYLIQIYETIFRDSCPKYLTLGQVYDSIQSKVNKLFQKDQPQKPDIDKLYRTINNQISNIDSGTPIESIEILKTIREILNFIREDRLFELGLIHEIQLKQVQSNSIFPQYIRDNLIELIKYRNAASHKSRIPLSEFEAIRTLYCLVSLVVWWNKELSKIEWSDDQIVIIQKIIDRNNVPGLK